MSDDNIWTDDCAPVRYLMASTRRTPEVAEYPDLGQIAVQAQTGSQTGKPCSQPIVEGLYERLWFLHDVEPG